VLTRFFGVVAGRARLFQAGVLVLAVVLGALVQADRLDAFVVLLVLPLALLALYVLAAYRYHPAALVVRPEPPAFATATILAPVFMAAAFTILAGCMVSEGVSDIVAGEDFWALNVVMVGFWVLVVGLHLYASWGSFGVSLRPEGVHNHQPLGSMFVPWEAFAPGYPAVPVKNNGLVLYYQRPELIRRRGLRVGSDSLRTGTDATYLAHVIQQYVAGPEHRPAIGTEAELRRLTARVAA
jgi:hypothetical protein